MRVALLAVLLAATPASAIAQDREPVGTPAAQNPAPGPAPAAAPTAQLSAARKVIEAQLRQPPRPRQRQQSRLEREEALERYLETVGKPVERQPATRGPR